VQIAACAREIPERAAVGADRAQVGLGEVVRRALEGDRLAVGEYDGVAPAAFVTTVAPVPSAPTVQMPPAAHVYASRLPSGDHAGHRPSAKRLRSVASAG
jgi:hypothetical protein